MKRGGEEERKQPEFEGLEGRKVAQLQLLAAVEGVGVVAVLVGADDQVGERRQVREGECAEFHAAAIVHQNGLETGQV